MNTGSAGDFQVSERGVIHARLWRQDLHTLLQVLEVTSLDEFSMRQEYTCVGPRLGDADGASFGISGRADCCLMEAVNPTVPPCRVRNVLDLG